ncbi:hypothetical protein [Sphaerisporangium fuscum]|uniref:hypothetical protein n=1 Tax=Sphaerisporangium fuscum TaxID=2835868 RepID=UPI002029A3EE|nr:hypothetical protein [Sphaerisporangium fuscum]
MIQESTQRVADNLTDQAALHDEKALREMVAAGVHTFLYGYAKRTGHDAGI